MFRSLRNPLNLTLALKQLLELQANFPPQPLAAMNTWIIERQAGCSMVLKNDRYVA
ncbi:unnamed protein product, partial [Dovyalis caffra]